MKLNKILFVLVPMWIIATSNLCYAQTKVGIRGGLNASNISFATLPDRSETYGYHLGLLLDIPALPGFLSIQPEVSFSTKGAAYSYLGVRRSITMNSVDLLVPVAFKLNSISLQVGPFVSFLIEKPVFTSYSNNAVILNGFNKVDSGLSAGISYNFSRLFFGLRYNQGLINVSNDEIISVIGEGKNAVGQVSIGYWF